MSYGLVLVTAPTLEPLSRPEAAKQVRVPEEGGYYDAELDRLIKAARLEVERRLNRQLIYATYDYKFDRFPCGYDGVIYVPKAPLYTLVSSEDYPGLGITYLDASGDSQTLATSVYKVLSSREPGEIRLKSGQAWPVVYDEADAVTIRFVAGYGETASSVPEGIRQAMLMMITDWFENRMGEGEVSPAVNSLLASHSVGDEFHAYAG